MGPGLTAGRATAWAAYAAFARFAIYTRLIGTKIAELPGWVTFWNPAGLFDVVDKNGDGIVQWADFVVKSTDFVVLATPEIAGLPFVVSGMVAAGALAAALSTALRVQPSNTAFSPTASSPTTSPWS